MVMTEVEISRQCLRTSRLVADNIVERGHCFRGVVIDLVCESGTDLFSMRSTIVFCNGADRGEVQVPLGH